MTSEWKVRWDGTTGKTQVRDDGWVSGRVHGRGVLRIHWSSSWILLIRHFKVSGVLSILC